MVDYRVGYIDALNHFCNKEVDRIEVLEKNTQGDPIRTRIVKVKLFTDKITETTSKGQVQKIWSKIRTHYESVLFPKVKKDILADIKKDLKNSLGREPTPKEITIPFQTAWDDPDYDKRHPLFRKLYENFKACSDGAIYLTGGERGVYLANYKTKYTCSFCFKDGKITASTPRRKEGYFTNFCSLECLKKHYQELEKKHVSIRCVECNKEIRDTPKKLRLADKPTCSWDCLKKNLEKRHVDFKKCANCPKIQVYLMKSWGEEPEKGWVKKGRDWYCSILEYGRKRIGKLQEAVEKLPGWKGLRPLDKNNFLVDYVNTLTPGAEKVAPDGKKFDPPRYHYLPADQWWEIDSIKWNEVLNQAKKLISSSGHIPTLDDERQACIEELELLSDWNLLDESVKKSLRQKAKTAPDLSSLKAIVVEARNEISKKKTSGGGNTDQIARDAAIAEVQSLLNSLLTKWKRSTILPSSWKNNFTKSNAPDLVKVNQFKQQYLNVLNRFDVRSEIMAKLAEFSASLEDTLGITDLKSHFASLSGSAITDEKNLLLDKICNLKTDRLAEVEAAITEIRSAISNAGMDSQTETKELGNNWENNFKKDFRYEESTKIQARKVKIISVIDQFAAQNLAACQAIFDSLEKALRESGLNESILGANWKSNFHGKNGDGRAAERNRLMGLIEKAVEGSNLNQQEKGQEKKKLAAESARAAQAEVKSKLTTAHPKLVVKESEIPAELLAPYKTITEKLAACSSVKEVEEVESKILAAVETKRMDKLSTIRTTAINTIKKAAEGVNIQWGANEEFDKVINGLVDPDEIEKKQNYLLKLVQEQKSAQQKDETQNNKPSAAPSSFPLMKTLGIGVLIVIPVALVVGIIFHQRRIKQRRKG